MPLCQLAEGHFAYLKGDYMEPQEFTEDEIKQQWARFSQRHLIFDVTDEFTVKVISCQVKKTWYGWLEVGDKTRANSRVLSQIRSIFIEGGEDDPSEDEEFFLIFPYELSPRGLLPDWYWIFYFEGSHRDVGDTTYYVRGKPVVYFCSSLDESPYTIAERIVSQVEWKVQSKPYEEDEWD